jgi:signal transduction histidine kinase
VIPIASTGGGFLSSSAPTLRFYVLTQVHNAFAGPAQAKGLGFKVVPSLLWVQSDPVVLARIVSNLGTNAVRYTERGRVLVGCRLRGGGDCVEIQVLDTGIGIAEDQQARIFEEFYQAGQPARDGEQGLGLGLAIVRRSAALIGGEVGVESVVGRGRVFRSRCRARERSRLCQWSQRRKGLRRGRGWYW